MLDSLDWGSAALFGGSDTGSLQWHQVAARAIVVFALGVAAVRLGKSRLLGRMTPLDVLLGFILGSLLSRGITGNASLVNTAVATAVLVAAHWLLTRWACHSHAIGVLLKGSPVELVRDGKIEQSNMDVSHISQHDLDEELRLAGVGDIADVQLATKERNGQVSVLRRKGA